MGAMVSTEVATEGEGSKQRQSAPHSAVRRGEAMLAATIIASSSPSPDTRQRDHLGAPRDIAYATGGGRLEMMGVRQVCL